MKVDACYKALGASLKEKIMVDQTLQCIRESMISLLKQKEYSKIQMKEIAENAHIGRKTLYRYFDGKEQIIKYIAESLMDLFAIEIQAQKELTLPKVTYAFFVFVESNREELLLLKKTGLLSYIEDHLFELVTQVAAKTKFHDKTPEEIEQIEKSASPENRYALYYTLAGYWRIGMAWITEENRQTPKQMAEIAVKIMTGKL